MAFAEASFHQKLHSANLQHQFAHFSYEQAMSSLNNLNILQHGLIFGDIPIQDERTHIIQFRGHVQDFGETLGSLAALVSNLKSEVVQNIKTWKHEQQKMANTLSGLAHTISLDVIEGRCGEVFQCLHQCLLLTKNFYWMLLRDDVQVPEVENREAIQHTNNEFRSLLLDLLSNALVVEIQPQIIKFGTDFYKPILVNLRVGGENVGALVADMSSISMEIMQHNRLNELVPYEVQGVRFLNGTKQMLYDYSLKRYRVEFKKVRLEFPKNANRKKASSDKVAEVKSCLRFKISVYLNDEPFHLFSDSMPIVVISHSSQMPTAELAIAWDNAFCEMNRVGFKVKDEAPWGDVMQILNAVSHKMTGRQLTRTNLNCLTKKAFGGIFPQPQIISRFNLKSTLWDWFYAANKMIADDKYVFKPLWNAGIMYGFIEECIAEQVLLAEPDGTIIVRFMEQEKSTLSIFYIQKKNGTVDIFRYGPYGTKYFTEKTIVDLIDEIINLRQVYRENQIPIPKEEIHTFIRPPKRSNNYDGYTYPKCLQYNERTTNVVVTL